MSCLASHERASLVLLLALLLAVVWVLASVPPATLPRMLDGGVFELEEEDAGDGGG